MTKPTASLSLDLDNLWVYLKTRGHGGWEASQSFLPALVPAVLDVLRRRNLTITFFVVGRDAARDEHRECLRQIVAAGHECGNHSFLHEPWIRDHPKTRVAQELTAADRAIEDATGRRPVGFRGPGYCYSAATVEVVRELGYGFDASLLPSVIGPVARLYYLWGSRLSRKDRESRGGLYGNLRDGALPVGPFEWSTRSGGVLEIPVTPVPFLRLPFHPSYVLWLSRRSRRLAVWYLRFGLWMCRRSGVEPSIILHPLDFLDDAAAPGLSFFPGMDIPRARKARLVSRYLDELQEHFDVVPLSEHARRIRAAGGSLRAIEAPETAAS
jgi:hypothetical protein